MKLPALREELIISDGPRLHDGQPSWTLQDPARNRFFQLDWLTFEILQRWSLGDPELIAQRVREQSPLHPTEEDVAAVLKFAGTNQLLSFGGANNSAMLAELCARARPGWAKWLLHNYLFFRVPLVKPQALLRWLETRLRFLFTRSFWLLTLLAGIVGLALIWREWDGFKATWFDLTNLNGILGYAAVLVFVKVLHEFGHGLTAVHFGCRVPTMGIAFLVMTPVAYTDTNEAWKLTDRRGRLWIGAAGMLAELSLAAWATLAWGLLPEGYLRSVAFMVATITCVKSLAVNTSPIMRFDGYYLLSDALDLPNLHSRAFALARWRLREWLFRLDEPPPENFSPTMRRGLVALAIFIWCYRLVVFTAIAVFVYHFFFKALGVVLFAVEIAWFVALPLVSEFAVWFKKRGAILRSRRRWPLALAASAVLVAICTPWPRTVRLTGQLYPGQEFKITLPESARLKVLGIHDGDRVTEGQQLLMLDSDLLRFRLAKATSREGTLVDAIASAGADPTLRVRLPVLQAELETARASRREAEVELAKLQPTAPFAGVFRLTDCDVRPGEQLAKQEQIASVFAERDWLVVAYLDEQDAHLVHDGAAANLYPEGNPGRSVKLTVNMVEADASRTIAHPMLTTAFGGKVSAKVVEGELLPDRAVYRVLLRVDDLPQELTTQIRRGRVAIEARAESMLSRWSRNALSLLWREFGF